MKDKCLHVHVGNDTKACTVYLSLFHGRFNSCANHAPRTPDRTRSRAIRRSSDGKNGFCSVCLFAVIRSLQKSYSVITSFE